jgi:aspartyl-tRNA(Asn)/glutamyl-tRNA(Gln) amidotransferase subunit C
MKVTAEEAVRIAALAHLELTAAEREHMAGELSAILDYIDQLKRVDLSGADSVADLPATPLREDEVRPSLDLEVVERNAPAFADRHFVVPKIIG